eukprot:1230649-Rhodomonas_salina.1
MRRVLVLQANRLEWTADGMLQAESVVRTVLGLRRVHGRLVPADQRPCSWRPCPWSSCASFHLGA